MLRNALGSAALLLLLVAGGVRGDAPPDVGGAGGLTDPRWTSALTAYLRDPVSGGRALRDLARNRPPGLPPVVLMALADAELRVGHTRSAARLFREVRELDPDGRWAEWADMGLASVAVLSDDVSDARDGVERLAASDSPNAPTAMMVLGLLDARRGDLAAAASGFRRVAAAPRASESLREAARLGLAYITYWQGDLGGAVGAFGAVATANPGGPLADDARYGAAWARLRRGDPEAVAALQSLADAYSPDGRRIALGRAAVELEPSAVLRGSFRRYRRSAIQAPDKVVAGVLDGDGAALAHAALRRLDRAEPEPPMAHTPEDSAAVASAPSPAVGQGDARRAPDAAPRRAPSPPAPGQGGWLRLLAVAVVGAVVLVAWRWSSGARR